MITKGIKTSEDKERSVKMTAKILGMVVIEVIERLIGIKKGGPFEEPLNQIVLNKYTALKLSEELNEENQKDK